MRDSILVQNLASESHQLPEIRRGFTLLELLVVLAIISVLLALIMSGVQRARGAAARIGCANNLRQLGLALQAHSAQHGKLPTGCSYELVSGDPLGHSHTGVSWHTSVLPYVEQADLWQRAVAAYTRSPNGSSSEHDPIRTAGVGVYRCSSDGRVIGEQNPTFTFALTSYRGVAGTGIKRDDGLFHPRLVVKLGDVLDGTSNTLAIGERPSGPNGGYGSWYAGWGSCVCQLSQLQPIAIEPWIASEAVGCLPPRTAFRPGRLEDWCDVNHFWSPHSGGANFAFADGSVRFLRYSADDIMPALATRAGGEVVAVPD